MTGEGDQRTAVNEQIIQDSGVAPEGTATLEPTQPEIPDHAQASISAAKEEARRAKEVADFYRELYKKQVEPAQQTLSGTTGTELNLNDDDLVDGAMMRQILERQKEELSILRESIERASIETAAERMRATTPDFDNAFNLGLEVLNTYPEFQHAVRATADKVRFVYNLAKHHPAYQPAPVKNVEQTLHNISTNVQKPATLSGVPGSSGAVGGFKQMDNGDFSKFMKDVLDGNVR